ncbi:hypothetical protein Glove_168g235 [Diversispora epigaea]|uniref:DUF155 domain-containing protein n=1 Tax=Diversispora epigaea TaxID=1348612 RepID=A0A397IVV1_9GLOM|nr:hypothetical protein Glove_168g235 [Diversispora epigaea]
MSEEDNYKPKNNNIGKPIIRFQQPETIGSTSSPQTKVKRTSYSLIPGAVSTLGGDILLGGGGGDGLGDDLIDEVKGEDGMDALVEVIDEVIRGGVIRNRIKPNTKPVKPMTPLRTTKTSQKLVLLPEEIEEISDYGVEAPLTPVTPRISSPVPSFRENDRTDAERMQKEVRDDAKYPRVTAYCTAEGYYLGILMDFLRREHNVQPKRFVECIYAPYHFPLNSGRNSNIVSSSAIQSPNGHSFVERQIENFENGQDLFEFVFDEDEDDEVEGGGRGGREEGGEREEEDDDERRRIKKNRLKTTLFKIGEVFYFDYGVVVFWNLTEEQEILCLRDLSAAGVMARQLKKEDIECETFHFQYDFDSFRKPRIFNDMITLKSCNHMIKLTISHAISQSTKLGLYEWQMAHTIEETKHIPKMLTQTGRLNLDRSQVTKLSGEMFKLRMNVNLVSNVLDTPEIFWSEPSLQPLYNVIRAYLEISQRTKVLNERCSVISDMLDMLREDVGNTNMTKITWIIIWLIVLAVLVAIGEIAVKLYIIRYY